jgi:stage II sporulation protein D
MQPRIKIFRNIAILCTGLSVLLGGCVAEPQGSEPVITQSPSLSSVRVLLDDSAQKIQFKIDDEYEIVNYDTMEIFKAEGTACVIEPATDSNGIWAGQQLFKTKHLIIQPKHNQPFAINDNQKYRGGLELIINSGSRTMTVINNVSMETYLAGVVASEMPSYWEMEALKAQAIAARTYCLYIKTKFGKNRNWDVKTTQANQVYKGVNAETVRTNDAVNSTCGMVLCCQQESGDCEPFPAYYSSACGGHTEDSENVFGDKFESLKGVNCAYCRTTTRPSLFYWPDVKFDKKTVSDNILERYPSLKELGTIEKIEAVKKSEYENKFTRITSVKLTGSTGKTGFLRAEDLRLAIDSSGTKIQSACCTIVSLDKEFLFVAGKGFGHGVGLCQYGAREMARQGNTAEQILSFYYPDNRIKTLY